MQYFSRKRTIPSIEFQMSFKGLLMSPREFFVFLVAAMIALCSSIGGELFPTRGVPDVALSPVPSASPSAAAALTTTTPFESPTALPPQTSSPQMTTDLLRTRMMGAAQHAGSYRFKETFHTFGGIEPVETGEIAMSQGMKTQAPDGSIDAYYVGEKKYYLHDAQWFLQYASLADGPPSRDGWYGPLSGLFQTTESIESWNFVGIEHLDNRAEYVVRTTGSENDELRIDASTFLPIVLIEHRTIAPDTVTGELGDLVWDFFDFGAPVDVAIPMAVLDATDPCAVAAATPLSGRRAELTFETATSIGQTVDLDTLVAIRRVLEERLTCLAPDATVTIRGSNQIVVALDLVRDPSSLVGPLTEVSRFEIIDPQGEQLPPGAVVRTTNDAPYDVASPAAVSQPGDKGQIYSTIITSEDVQSVFPTTNALGQTVVGFELTVSGGAVMSDFTEANLGKPMSIVLDKIVIASPTINGAITSEGIIEGLSEQEVFNYVYVLDLALTHGVLPAPLTLVDIQTLDEPAS